MIELSEQQRRQLESGQAVDVTDAQTAGPYVVLRKDVYERLRAIVDGITRRAGWDDPAMDVYEQYRKPS